MTISPSTSQPAQKIENESITAYFGDGLLAQFVKGETIVSGLSEPKGTYLIKEGFIKAYSISPAGNASLLVIHEVGEFIPLPGALDGAHTTGLFYEAMTDVTTLRVSKDKLRTEMGNNSWLSQEILKQAVDLLGIYTQRIQILEHRTAREKVIAELLCLLLSALITPIKPAIELHYIRKALREGRLPRYVP